MVKKIIKYEYYQMTQSVEEGREALFDLVAWIANIDELNLNDRTHPYNEDTVRLEESFYHMTYGTWFIRFMRQRPNDVPSFSGRNRASEFMELEEDQFVSEDVTCLYDADTHVLMIQKNSHSVSPVGIELYLNLTTPTDVVVNLRKVVSTDSFERVRNSRKCSKAIIRIADLPTLRNRGMLGNLRSSIGEMVRGMQHSPSPFVEFTFSVGMDRNAQIEEDEINRIVDDVERNPLLFDRARLSVIEENETKSKMIDLFLDSPKEEITFNTERVNPIRFDAMMDAMAQKYCPGEGRENRKREIDRYILDRR